MIRPQLVAAITLLAMALALVGPRITAAQLSPGISPSKVEYDEPLGQGEHVDLPVVSVSNNASGQDSVRFTMDLLVHAQEELAPALAWFRFDPDTFTLESGERQQVHVEMVIPREAEPGSYVTFVRATAAALGDDKEGGGVAAQAAVAMTVRFSVKNVNFHFYDPVTNFFTGRAPFSYIGTGMLLALLAFYLFQRTYGIEFNLGVRRKE